MNFKVFWKTLVLSLAVASLSHAKNRIPDIEDSLVGKQGLNQTSVDSGSVEILIWNMFKQEDAEWRSDIEQLSDGKDIVMVQEAYLSESIGQYMKTYDQFTINMAISFEDGDGIPTGVGTAVNGKILSALPLRSRGLEPGVALLGFGRTPKMSLVQKVKLNNGQILTIANVHALNSASLDKYKAQIEDVLSEIDCERGPAVVAGDFNTLRHNSLISGGDRKPWLLETMAAKDLEKVDFGEQEKILEVSYPRLGIPAGIVDYAFVCGGEISEQRVYGEIETSDHKPFGFTLSFE